MSTTRTAARRAVAGELGGYALATTLGVSTNRVLSVPAVAGSTELPSSAWAYVWAYAPSIAGIAEARITQTGLAGGLGTITLERDLGAVLASGTPLELHSKLPPIGGSQRPPGLLSVDECVNLALRHLLTHDDTATTLALVSGQRDYGNLPAWLDRAERLLDIRQPDALGLSYISTPRRWEFREAGRGATIHFPAPFRFSSGTYSVRLVVLRPADTLIKVGGVWGDSTVGLVNETDEAGPDMNAIVAVALAFAYKTLRDNAAASSRDRYDKLYATQVAEARKVRNYNRDIDPFADVPKTATAAPAEAA